MRATPIRILLADPRARRVAFAYAILVGGGFLMRQGEAGNRYIAIADGTAEVIRDGLTIARVSRADGVGETALLRQVPHTASVRAVTPVHGLAITQEEFLVAVTGHDGDRSAEPTNE